MIKLITSPVIFTLLLMAVMSQTKAQSDFRIQSIFIYNFTRLVAWPTEYQTGDFVLAVFGNSPIHEHLVSIAATKKAGNQNIVVKTFNSATEITKCHIIYVPAPQSRRLEEIIATLNSKNIKALIVTDSRDAISRGSVVNFTVIDNRQRFELSATNAAHMGLALGTEISRLAIQAN